MNKPGAILLLLLLTAAWSCNRSTQSNDPSSGTTDLAIDTLADADSIQINDSIMREMAKLRYADSLTAALVNDLTPLKDSLFNGRIGYEAFMNRLQKLEKAYIDYRQEEKFVFPPDVPSVLSEYQRDTFRLNERLRLFDEYFMTTSDMELSYYIYLDALNQIRDSFEERFNKLPVNRSIITAFIREKELREELDAHEQAFSSNIFSPEYLPGAIYSMIHRGSQIANHELATQSAVNLYLLFSEGGYQITAEKLPKEWLPSQRGMLRTSYRQLYPLISDTDRMILEEEHSLFEEFIEARLQIISQSKGNQKEGLMADLAHRIIRKQSDLNYYKKALNHELFNAEEEDGGEFTDEGDYEEGEEGEEETSENIQ